MNGLWQYKSLLLALLGLLVIAGFFALWSWLSTGRVRSDATEDWDYRERENMQDLRLNRDGYIRAFCLVHAPRKSKYIALTLAALALLTLPAFALIERLLYGIWIISGQSRVFEPPFLVWQFSIYFAILTVWILIVTWFYRQFYKNSPGLMRDALVQERADFVPVRPLIIGPNPAQLKACDYGDNGRDILRTIFEDALGLNRKSDQIWNRGECQYDSYSDGSDMQINVHFCVAQSAFTDKSHPFFFPGAFARADDKPPHFTIIRKMDGVWPALKIVRSSGLEIEKSSGSETSATGSFTASKLDVFLYKN